MQALKHLNNCAAVSAHFQQWMKCCFNLYYCYNKNGETAKAEAIKKLMSEKYAASNFTTIVTPVKIPSQKLKMMIATKTYEKIYDLFIEGKFEEAVAQKKVADSIYGKNYWTPQLLYIEAVYYIKQRNDSAAKRVLNDIINQFAQSPLAAKAHNLLDVLSRRTQIEEELRNLVVNRATDSTTAADNRVPVVTRTNQYKIQLPVQQHRPSVNKPIQPAQNTDTTVNKTNSPLLHLHMQLNPHYVVLVLNKVDPVFVNEAKNAFSGYNRDTYYNKK